MQSFQLLARSNKFFAIAAFAVALVMAAALFGASPDTASAKSLTSSQRAKLALTICGLEKGGLVDQSTHSWKKVKITGVVRASMAAEYLCAYKHTWLFSKAKLKRTSKAFFGSDKVTIGGSVYKDTNSGKYTTGGWGDVYCKVTKKMKYLGKGCYRAKAVFGIDPGIPVDDHTLTYYRVKLKKSSKSPMGYRIVGINAKNDRD